MTQFNRAARRRLKKALNMPFTPSAEFTEQYMAKMEKAGAVQRVQAQEPVKVRVQRRAFEGAEDASK